MTDIVQIPPAEAGSKMALAARTRMDAYAAYVHGYQPSSIHDSWYHEIERTISGQNDEPNLLLMAPPGTAKALALDTPIPTPTGWTTMADLVPGDLVFGMDGQPTEVIAKSQVWRDRPVYTVRSSDGGEIVADAEHLWRARLDQKSGRFAIYTTKIIARPRGKRAMVTVNRPLQLPHRDLPLDPYLLGLWLGDGYTESPRISKSEEDISFFRSELSGYETAVHAGTRLSILGITPSLRDMGVWGNKHVPQEYLRAGNLQRLALLQGLIDTDAHVSPAGEICFTNTNRGLVQAAQELVRSLGRKCGEIKTFRAMLKGQDCGEAYKIHFHMRCAARLPRKRALTRDGVRTPDLYIEAKLSGVADTVCIQVAAEDGMFLAGRSMVPTHNSTVVAHVLPSYYLGIHPDHHIFMMTASDSMATTRLSVVREVIEHSPKHLSVFPEEACRPNKDRGWSSEGLYLAGTSSSEADPAYRAMGFKSNILGGRAHGIILDDPLTQEEANSPAEMETARNRFTGTIETRTAGMPGAWIIAIMTRWNEADFASFLKKLGGWKFLNYPALGKYPWGRSIWPGRFPVERFEELRRRNPAEFEALYQGDPTALGGSVFKQRNWFQPLPEDFKKPGPTGLSPMKELPIIQFWDLAYSSRQTADYTVALTARIDQVGAVFLTDRLKTHVQALGLEEDPDEREMGEKQDDKYGLSAMMARHIAQTRPILIGVPLDAYKTNYCKRLIVRVSRMLRKMEVSTRIMGVKVDTDKITRANTAAGIAQAGDVYLDLEEEWSEDFIRQCFPADTLIAAQDVSAAMIRQYTGDLITIQTPRGTIEVTPEHPFWTPHGWRTAGTLSQDSQLLYNPLCGEGVYSGRIGDLVETCFRDDADTSRGDDGYQPQRGVQAHQAVEETPSVLGVPETKADAVVQSAVGVSSRPDRWRGHGQRQDDRLQMEGRGVGCEYRLPADGVVEVSHPWPWSARRSAKLAEITQVEDCLQVRDPGDDVPPTLQGADAVPSPQGAADGFGDRVFRDEASTVSSGGVDATAARDHQGDSTPQWEGIISVSRRAVVDLPVFNITTESRTYRALGYLVHNCLGFPARTHDDDVDAFSGLVLMSIENADWLSQARGSYGFTPLDVEIESEDNPDWNPWREHDAAMAEAKRPLIEATGGHFR